MKVFTTKYALSGGIEEKEVEPPDGNGYVYSGLWRIQYRIGRDAFLTREEAVADAEARRAAKIASLLKQIAKLKKLTFAAK